MLTHRACTFIRLSFCPLRLVRESAFGGTTDHSSRPAVAFVLRPFGEPLITRKPADGQSGIAGTSAPDYCATRRVVPLAHPLSFRAARATPQRAVRRAFKPAVLVLLVRNSRLWNTSTCLGSCPGVVNNWHSFPSARILYDSPPKHHRQYPSQGSPEAANTSNPRVTNPPDVSHQAIIQTQTVSVRLTGMHSMLGIAFSDPSWPGP